jgi:hypothetical protein
MKVSMYGFSLKAGDGITLHEFMQHLVAISSVVTEYNFSTHPRLFLFSDSPDADFYAGLFVTIKDHKKFCKLRREGGAVTIKVDELGDDESLMEFNFFIINKRTNAGLYMHYHASCSMGQFGAFLRDRWKELKVPKIEQLVRASIDDRKYKSELDAVKAAKKAFRRNVQLIPYFRPEAFRELLEEFSRIRSLEYPVATIDIGTQGFRPLKSQVKKATQRLVFDAATPLQLLVKRIANFQRRAGFVKGRVTGDDEDGELYSIKIEGNLDKFDEADFDDLAEDLNIGLDDYAASAVVRNLIEKARAYGAMFMVAEDDDG